MITSRFANDYGRHVFAVPGRIDSNQSSGCLSLIKDGAIMLTCVEDIFDELPYLSDSIRQETFELKETILTEMLLHLLGIWALHRA